MARRDGPRHPVEVSGTPGQYRSKADAWESAWVCDTESSVRHIAHTDGLRHPSICITHPCLVGHAEPHLVVRNRPVGVMCASLFVTARVTRALDEWTGVGCRLHMLS